MTKTLGLRCARSPCHGCGAAMCGSGWRVNCLLKTAILLHRRCTREISYSSGRGALPARRFRAAQKGVGLVCRLLVARM